MSTHPILAAMLCGFALTIQATLAVGVQSTALVLPRSVDAGEQLLGALACADCHQATPAAQVRLTPRTGPRLGGEALRLTPGFIRSWLQDPQAAKPGTTMPDMLHGLPVLEKGEAIEDLTHFLMSVQSVDTNAPVAVDQFKIELGRRLFHEAGCVACHAPIDSKEGVSEADLNKAKAHSIPFPDLSRKTTVAELGRFLRDPAKSRPNGRMPSLNLSPREAESIAMYLMRGQAVGLDDPSKARKFPGVRYQYYEGEFGDESALEKAEVKASGVVDDFRLKPRAREDNVGFRFTGFIRIAESGEYTFYTRSDDGSRLRIGTQLVVDNWGVHPTTEKSGKLILTAGDHPFQLTWFNGGGETSLEVLWEGPGIAKQRLPKTVLTQMSVPMEPIGLETFAVDTARASRGRDRFASLGCASCHAVQDTGGAVVSLLAAKPLNALKANPEAGCLASTVSGKLPRYALSPEQRSALSGVLRRVETLDAPLDEAAQIDQTLARLNCLVCHSRDGIGGPETTGKSPWFTVVGEADLGDEGRIPPHLTKVGGKLKPAWLTEVLAKGTKTRPYMATRMPVFGEAHVGMLAKAFETADAGGVAAVEPASTARDMKAGWKLVGSEGLSCIACHTFGPHKSLGIPAMDLTQMQRRLRSDWFERYLVDPAALRPGTRMPTFWPEGRAVNRDILDGNTGAQVRAIWAYLSKGGQADVPTGLIRAKKEFVVGNEPVIYRNFIEGSGSRAIAVGYPEHAHLSFDANELRLALIWQGAFIDLSRHTTDRGVGYEPPLGDHQVKLPAGPGFALLADPTAPWPKETARTLGWQFQGYTLDANRRPIFRYRLGDLQIEDFPEPKKGELDVSLKRTLVVKGQGGGNLVFRAAVGDIRALPGGQYQVEGDLKLTLTGGGKPILVGNELRVPVPVNGGSVTLVEEFVW